MKTGVPALVLASSLEELLRIQRDAIFAHGRQLTRPLAILEAGCGQRWLIDLDGLDYSLTGLDLDPTALELRRTMTKDLHVAVCGDLCSVQLPPESFDVVYSWYVLEHVSRADLALRNLVKWLRPGGLLILCLPDRDSVRGFLARLLPHWVAVFYYRHICGMSWAGRPGHGPYPNSYHPVIGRERLCAFLSEHGMECIRCYGDGFNQFKSETSRRLVSSALSGIAAIVQALSLGRLRADYSDVLYIAKKTAASHPASWIHLARNPC